MKVFGIIAASTGACAYAINLVFARVASLKGFSPADLMLYPIVLLLVVLGLYLLLKKHSFVVKPTAYKLIFIMGCITAVAGLCFFTAVKFIPVSLAAVIVYSFPLFILILTPFVEKTPVHWHLFAMFGVAFMGLMMVLTPSFEGLDSRGLIAAVLATLLTTAQFFIAKRATSQVPTTLLVFYVHLIALPMVYFASFFMGGLSSFDKITAEPFTIIIIVLGYILGFSMQMLASKWLTPAFNGLVFCLEPVVSLITASIVLHERLSPLQLLGAIVVIGVLALTSLYELKRQPA